MNGLPGSSFLGWAGDEKNQAIRTLNILADMQKAQLVQLFKELREETGTLAKDRFMKEQLELHLSEHSGTTETAAPLPHAGPRDHGLGAWLRESLSDKNYYHAIYILNIVSGDLIASTNTSSAKRILSEKFFIHRIMTTRQDYVGGFAPVNAPVSFLVGSPIFLTEKNPEILLVLEVSLQPFLQPQLSITKGPWPTMEAIIVNEHGVNLLHPERQHSDKIQGHSNNITLLPSRIAASGQEGFIETQDQNNVAVLAGYRHIRLFSEWSFGLVIQMNQDDLLRPTSTAFGFAFIIGLMSTGGFVIVAYVLTRRLTSPLRQLTEAARKLTTGHRHVRLQHQGDDELGVLARAFDTMADEVARTLDNLEKTVAQRTMALEKELEIKIQQQHEQLLVENSLKESEQRYRSLVDNMTSGVAVYAATGDGNDFIFWDLNRIGEQLTKTVKINVIGKPVGEVFPGVVEFGLFAILKKVYTTGIPCNHPVSLYSDHRLEQWFENRVYKLPSGEIVAIFDDISERKRAEDELEMVQFSVDNTHDAFFWFAKSGRIIRTNHAASTLLGYAREELLALSITDIYANLSTESWLRQWQKIHLSNTMVHNSHMLRRDRSQFPVEISFSYLCGDSNKADSIFASVRDITERINAENEKQALEKIAFHRERLATIGTLAAGVAHEINNPNNSIRFNAGILQDIWPDLKTLLHRAIEEEGDFLLSGLPASESLETIPRLFEGIRKSSERIKNIIGNLKHLSRQNQELERRPVHLKTILKESVTLLQNQISLSTDHFHMKLSEDAIIILGNSQQLEQIFINLILNALQSLPSRDRAVNIAIAEKHRPNEIQVLITDEGIGIPKENLDKLTHPFFTTKAGQDGTGLGLSIARSFVENHGGRLKFSSQENSGTTVTVTLPTVDASKQGEDP